jgi:hypothetical protein
MIIWLLSWRALGVQGLLNCLKDVQVSLQLSSAWLELSN